MTHRHHIKIYSPIVSHDLACETKCGAMFETDERISLSTLIFERYFVSLPQ